MSGLEKEFPGKVQAHLKDATTPPNEQACREAGFQSHGLTITAADGKILWKQADHTVNVNDVRKQLTTLLGG